MKTKVLELERLRLTYTEHGDGHPLILLHGNGQSRRVFRKAQMRTFSGYRTYAPDSRGHGKSVSADLDFSIERSCDDIIGFCQRLHLKQAHVIGYSDGGNIALFLAKKRPDLFDRIVTISPNCLFSGMEERVRRRLLLARRALGGLEKIRLPGMKKQGARFDLMMRDIGLGPEDLRSISASLYILYAEKDMIEEEHILSIARQIPAAKAVRIPGTTHLSILKEPRALCLMARFLAGQGGPLSD